MKKYFFLVITIILFSCANDPQSDTDANTESFELSETSLTLNRAKQTVTVQITSNIDWQAINVPNWITLSQYAGNGNVALSLEVERNNDQDGNPRIVTIQFIANNKVYLLTITQTTVPEDSTISILNNFEQNLDYNQHVFTIQVQSSLPWQAYKPDWVEVSPATGGAGITSVQITILPNPINNSQVRNQPVLFSTEIPLNINNNSTYAYQNINQNFNPIQTWNQIYLGEYYYNNKSGFQLEYNSLSNRLYFSYEPQFDPSKVYLEYYDGISWSFSSSYIYSLHRLAISSSNIPYVAYLNNGSLRSYAFSDITTPNFGTDLAYPDSIDFDITTTPNNERVVVYDDNNNYGGRITVKKSSGSTWQTLGTEGFSNGRAKNCTVETNANGEIYVAYYDTFLNKTVVKKFNGNSWDTIGEFASASRNIEMKIGTNNDVFVAYLNNDYKISVKKFSSGNWQILGVDGIITNNSLDYYSMALNNQNIPYIAYSGGNVQKFNGTSWVSLNKIRLVSNTNFETITDQIKIVIGNDNVPVIVYENNLNVIVAKYIE